uniref:non-specific serine/threonine protein kinase n=1 Tax=Giardia intestinalis TaxID=5741 RepID=O09433_GIAIN|nr:protein kinase [Giardia intestinalis]
MHSWGSWCRVLVMRDSRERARTDRDAMPAHARALHSVRDDVSAVMDTGSGSEAGRDLRFLVASEGAAQSLVQSDRLVLFLETNFMAGGSNHAASPPAVAPSVPHFVIEELHELLDGVLGRGVTGVVYALRGYPSLAVQEILLDGLGKSNVDAIRLELATLPDLSHPGILKYHQVVEDEGLIYVVTDRHDKTLEQVFIDCKRRKTPVSPELVLSVLRQLAAALAYLHGLSGVGANGLVHRNLRPASILVSADGEHFVIADFGLCRDALWSESTLMGIMAYMAPEVLLRNETSPASDMWSLGVIIYELTTLRRPDFLEGKDPKDVFVDGWTPDLSGVADGFMKSVLERIFVLEPKERLTTEELCKMLTAIDVPVGELGGQCVMLKYECGSLKTALNSANARIAILEAALDARSAETASLKDILETKAAKIDALEQELTAKSARSTRSRTRVKSIWPR